MLSSFSYNFKSNIANLKIFGIFVINNNKSFIFQNLKTVGPLGEKLDFFSPSGFEIQSNFDYRTSKIKFYSVSALKRCLNEKNPIHGQIMAAISKFSPQIFETCFNLKRISGVMFSPYLMVFNLWYCAASFQVVRSIVSLFIFCS